VPTLADKALENLTAGDVLLDRGLVNAAASRFYYSMYQAAVHGLTQRGFRPEVIRSGAVDWDHSMVENNSGFIRRRFEDRELYRELRRLRLIADYQEAAVNALKLRTRRAPIADFVKELTK
jgi:uncharacterized protein (UPF0332 family)